MLSSFIKYFFNYIFFSKARQKLLYLAFVGLFLSSFSLLVLQSSMKGLQSSQINRSKNVLGNAVIELKKQDKATAKKVETFLKDNKASFIPEYTIELLLNYDGIITPALIHGVDNSVELPSFLRTDNLEELVLPFDLGAQIQSELGGKVQLISPSHVDEFFDDIPRSITLYIEDYISTRVPEVDALHGWVPIRKIHNLIGEELVNQFTIFSLHDFEKMKNKLSATFGSDLVLKTWEDQNEMLVWSLKLESIVMLFLFISMTLLVSLCITLGLLIFFNKIKNDLASFWILGASKSKLEKSSWVLLNVMSITAIGFGIVCSLVFLFLFQKFGGEIMPDNFVDRKIPILVTLEGILISFFVPYLISLLVSLFSLIQFKKETNYLDQVRAI